MSRRRTRIGGTSSVAVCRYIATGTGEFQSLLGNLIRNASPGRKRMLAANLGVLALREHNRYFREEVSPSGAKWAPLAPSTIRRRYESRGRRNRRVFSWRVLQDTGMLRMSVTPGTSSADVGIRLGIGLEFYSAAVGAIRRVDSTGFEMGSNLSYAATHQWGDAGGRTLMVIVPSHRRRSHLVRSYTRVVRGSDRSVVVAAHRVKAHDVRSHVSRIVTRPIPARPFVGFSSALIARSMRFLSDSLMHVEGQS